MHLKGLKVGYKSITENTLLLAVRLKEMAGAWQNNNQDYVRTNWNQKAEAHL